MSSSFRFDDDPVPLDVLDKIIDCADAFELAWSQGERPVIESFRDAVEERWRHRLIAELLLLEIELRGHAGERPYREDYRERFPDHADLVRRLLKPRPRPSSAETARGLLFGLLALQNNFITRDQLLTALNAWITDKSRHLGQVLVERGYLDDARRELLEGLAREHVKLHDDDPEKSLADLSSLGPEREHLEAVPDDDLQASLTIAGQKDADDTIDYTTSAQSKAGQRFRVLREHARGGMGIVYEAEDTELGRTVALKRIQPDKVGRRHVRSRFVVEAEISGGLQHPGIVPIYSLGTYDDGLPLYAMRLVEGNSLRDAVKKHHEAHPRPDPGTVAFRDLLGRFLDVCNAIAFGHSRGVMHRDLKPTNIMIGEYGEALIIDWGLAKATGKRDPLSAGGREEKTLVPPSGSGVEPTEGVMGTPGFMSPEQAEGKNTSLGPATDVYGLGAILYHMLTGKAPVSGGTRAEILERVQRGEIAPPRSLNPNVPPALEAVCRKALALRPEDRHPTARALAEDVAHWLADEPVSARREPLAERAQRWVKNHRSLVVATAAALLVGFAGLGGIAAVQTRARADLDRKNGELTAVNTRLTEANTALDAQRQRAETREQQAIDAVKRFRDAVADNPTLKNSPELEDLRKTLLKEPLAFFRSLREGLQGERDTRPESLARLAEIIHDYAHLTDEIGDKQDGLKAHETAWRSGSA